MKRQHLSNLVATIQGTADHATGLGSFRPVRKRFYRRHAVQRYANVGGEKRLPYSKGRGLCPCCGGFSHTRRS